MKGYRTLVLSAFVVLAGPVLGHTVDPQIISSYIDLIFAAIGLATLGLRLVTDTPFGARIVADLGVSPGGVEATLARIAPDAPTDLGEALSALRAAVSVLADRSAAVAVPPAPDPAPVPAPVAAPSSTGA